MNKKAESTVYAGTSNIALPVSGKRFFPEAFQDKSRLIYYASLFNSIEINSSFKKIPQTRTVERWASEVPEGFQFTFKIPAIISHNKELAFEPRDIKNFLDVIDNIGDKKGCLLLQFPGKIGNDFFTPFSQLLKSIVNMDEDNLWKIAVEFRHASWYQQPLYDLLREHGAALVFHDMPLSSPPISNGTANFIYLRFHGTEKGYRGSYSDDFLHAYAQRIKEWIAAGKKVYVYFNNTLGAAAVNLQTLKSFLT